MALGDDIVVRLIVWEGQLRTGPIQQRQIKVYSDQLKSSINESLEETQWRYQMWKTYPSEIDGNYKLEVCCAQSIGLLLSSSLQPGPPPTP